MINFNNVFNWLLLIIIGIVLLMLPCKPILAIKFFIIGLVFLLIKILDEY